MEGDGVTEHLNQTPSTSESDVCSSSQHQNVTKSQTNKSRRHRTHLHCLTAPKNMGIKKDVKLNMHGQPIDKVASLMQSFIGVLAREKVKITYDSWKDVPIDVKESIWECVNLHFNIDKNWKRGCLSSACAKWRQFKSTLTKCVYERLETPELYTPPVEYDIPQGDWNDFVASRLTDDFKKLREEQQNLRSRNTLPYRFSRKGYARFGDENQTLLCDDVEINQATLWVEGRKSKGGIHEGDDLREKVAEIDELISKKKSGTVDLELRGRNSTILETALGKEHPGRLRGVGNYVAQSAYFKVPKGRKDYIKLCSQQQCELLEVNKRNSELESHIAMLEAAAFKEVEVDDDVDIQIFDKDVQFKKPDKLKHKVVESKVDLSTIPKPLRVVYGFCRMSAIKMDVDQIRACGIERTVWLNLEDVEPFCLLRPISYMCIVVYIWHLYNKLKKLKKVDKFMFADPYNLGHDASTEERAGELARFMSGCLPDQILLVPCNVGGHWILTVIDPHKEDIGVLDSLFAGGNDWKQVVELAFKIFNEKKLRPHKEAFVWTVIEVPHQPSFTECGYYVMRFMREIVHSTTFDSVGSLQSLFNKEMYSNEDIDESRTEWADTLQDFIN